MKQLSYSHLDKVYSEIEYTFGSDYSGDAVTRANYLTLRAELRRLRGVYDVYGGYGTYGIAYVPQELTKNGKTKIAEIVKALSDYPAIDDEKVSRLEWELIEKQFDDDYSRELKQYENEDGDIPKVLIDYAHTVVVNGIGDIAFIETGCVACINWNKVRANIDSCDEVLKIMETIA